MLFLVVSGDSTHRAGDKERDDESQGRLGAAARLGERRVDELGAESRSVEELRHLLLRDVVDGAGLVGKFRRKVVPVPPGGSAGGPAEFAAHGKRQGAATGNGSADVSLNVSKELRGICR